MLDFKQLAERPCILLIDDAPMHLRALNEILTDEYDVLVAKSGESGLEMAQQRTVDLILLDLVLPGMSGFAVLSQLKLLAKTKNIPVIMITSSDSPDDELMGLSLGAVDYVRKPFVNQIVKARVAIHLKLISQMRIIERFSLTDGLTGLSNRRSFDTTIIAEWTRAQRDKKPISMLMMDIDHFKKFNDRYGHLNGDICLQEAARTLRLHIKRGSDYVFRWGGEEFAILLPNTDAAGAHLVAEELRKAIEKMPIELEEETVYVTASFGVGTAIPAQDDPDEACKDFHADVDRALYSAKQNGRNRVACVEV